MKSLRAANGAAERFSSEELVVVPLVRVIAGVNGG